MNFITKVLNDQQQRLTCLAACCICLLGIGSMYALSAWNNYFKIAMKFKQSEIAFVGQMLTFGFYCSFHMGLIYDRWIGAYRAFLVSGFSLAFLYIILYLGLMIARPLMSQYIVGIIFFLIGQLSTQAVFGSLGHCGGLFGPSNCGKVSSALLFFFSASGAFFAVIFKTFFTNGVYAVFDFFLFLGVFLFIICMLAHLCIYRISDHTQMSEDPKAEKMLDNSTIVTPKVSSENVFVLPENAVSEAKEEVNLPALKVIKDIRFYMICMCLLTVNGSALLLMANLAFIAESLGAPASYTSALVMVFAVGNAGGRLLAGFCSDALLHVIPRAFFAAISVVLTCLVQIFLLSLPSNAIFLPALLSGIANGMMFTIYATLCREYFGSKYYGQNYGLMSLSVALGFPFFLGPVGNAFYSAHAQVVNGIEKCYGTVCYQNVFILIMILCIIAFFCCLKLIFLSRKEQRIKHANLLKLNP